MGDTYGAGLDVTGVPAHLVKTKTERSLYAPGETYLMLEGWRSPARYGEEDEGECFVYITTADGAADGVSRKEGPFDEDAAYARMEEVNKPIADLAQVWADHVVDSVSVTAHDDGTVSLSCSHSELSYGITQWEEAGLDDALQAAGLAFNMDDEGLYDNAGRALFWKPGMDAIQERTNTPAGWAMTQPELQAVLATVPEPFTVDGLLAAIAAWYDADPAALIPAKAEA